MKSSHKTILVFALTLLILSIFLPHHADAFLGVDLPDPREVALKMFDAILTIIRNAAASLLHIAAQFLKYALVDLTGSMPFYNNFFVQAGWQAVRDFANLGFVLFLLVAAVATILDLQNYGWKRIIPRLIIVALLVNLSLPLVAFAINIANLMMGFFTVNVASEAGYSDIGAALIAGFRVGDITADPSLESLKIANGGGDISTTMTSIINNITAIIFFLIAAVILFWLAMYLIVRIIALWVLIILSPLAIVASIFPATQSMFSRWLHQLTHWTFFGIAAAFFLWLATLLIFTVNTQNWADIQLVGGANYLSLTSKAGLLFSYATTAVFLVLALQTAKGASQGFAQMVVNTAGGLAMGAVGFAAGAAGRPALRRARRAVAESKTVRGFAEGTGKALERIRNVPILGGATRGAREGLMGLAGAGPMKDETEKEYKRLKASNLSPIQIARLASNTDSQGLKVATGRALSETNAYDKATTDDERHMVRRLQNQAYVIAESTGNTKEIENLAYNDKGYAERARERGIGYFKDLSDEEINKRFVGEHTFSEILQQPETAFNMSAANVRGVAQRGSPKQRKALAEAILGTEQKPVTEPPQGVSEEQFRFMQQLVQLNAALAETIGRTKAFGRAQAEVAAAQEAIGGDVTDIRQQLQTPPQEPKQEPEGTDKENKNV